MEGRYNTGKVCYRITVNLALQPEGCYMVTCEELPELATQGNTIDEALHQTLDAYVATIELYEDLGKEIPDSIVYPNANVPFPKFWQQLPKDDWTATNIASLFATKTPNKTNKYPLPYVFEATVPHELSETVKETQNAWLPRIILPKTRFSPKVV